MQVAAGGRAAERAGGQHPGGAEPRGPTPALVPSCKGCQCPCLCFMAEGDRTHRMSGSRPVGLQGAWCLNFQATFRLPRTLPTGAAASRCTDLQLHCEQAAPHLVKAATQRGCCCWQSLGEQPQPAAAGHPCGAIWCSTRCSAPAGVLLLWSLPACCQVADWR